MSQPVRRTSRTDLLTEEQPIKPLPSQQRSTDSLERSNEDSSSESKGCFAWFCGLLASFFRYLFCMSKKENDEPQEKTADKTDEKKSSPPLQKTNSQEPLKEQPSSHSTQPAPIPSSPTLQPQNKQLVPPPLQEPDTAPQCTTSSSSSTSSSPQSVPSLPVEQLVDPLPQGSSVDEELDPLVSVPVMTTSAQSSSSFSSTSSSLSLPDISPEESFGQEPQSSELVLAAPVVQEEISLPASQQPQPKPPIEQPLPTLSPPSPSISAAAPLSKELNESDVLKQAKDFCTEHVGCTSNGPLVRMLQIVSQFKESTAVFLGKKEPVQNRIFYNILADKKLELDIVERHALIGLYLGLLETERREQIEKVNGGPISEKTPVDQNALERFFLAGAAVSSEPQKKPEPTAPLVKASSSASSASSPSSQFPIKKEPTGKPAPQPAAPKQPPISKFPAVVKFLNEWCLTRLPASRCEFLIKGRHAFSKLTQNEQNDIFGALLQAALKNDTFYQVITTYIRPEILGLLRQMALKKRFKEKYTLSFDGSNEHLKLLASIFKEGYGPIFEADEFIGQCKRECPQNEGRPDWLKSAKEIFKGKSEVAQNLILQKILSSGITHKDLDMFRISQTPAVLGAVLEKQKVEKGYLDALRIYLTPDILGVRREAALRARFYEKYKTPLDKKNDDHLKLLEPFFKEGFGPRFEVDAFLQLIIKTKQDQEKEDFFFYKARALFKEKPADVQNQILSLILCSALTDSEYFKPLKSYLSKEILGAERRAALEKQFKDQNNAQFIDTEQQMKLLLPIFEQGF